jgi:hypothetical protein
MESSSLCVSASNTFKANGCYTRIYHKLKHRNLLIFLKILYVFPILLFAAHPKDLFFDGLKKLEQRSHKCGGLRAEYVEQIYFFNPVACCFLYRAKDLSAPLHICVPYNSQNME